MEEFKQSKKEQVEGDNFTMKESYSEYSLGDGVEFKPGETSESAKIERAKLQEGKAEISDIEYVEEYLSVFKDLKNKPFSETRIIKSNGEFEIVMQKDGQPVYLGLLDTPQKLYQIAAEITQKHPEYNFSFETDPEGRWMKYTVSKK